MTDSRRYGKPPMTGAIWSNALPPHTLENVGSDEIRIISIDLKNV
jgi:hypothetical protein